MALLPLGRRLADETGADLELRRIETPEHAELEVILGDFETQSFGVVVLSSVFSRRLTSDTIYTLELRRRGIQVDRPRLLRPRPPRPAPVPTGNR